MLVHKDRPGASVKMNKILINPCLPFLIVIEVTIKPTFAFLVVKAELTFPPPNASLSSTGYLSH